MTERVAQIGFMKWKSAHVCGASIPVQITDKLKEKLYGTGQFNCMAENVGYQKTCLKSECQK